MRYIISTIGVITAIGFIASSAFSNYLFSATIATDEHQLRLLQILAFCSVACASTCLFFASYYWRAGHYLAATGAFAMWLLAVCYSLEASFGLAATSRELSANKAENTIQDKEDIRKQLTYLYTLKQTPKTTTKIDELNKKLESKGETHTVDPQATFLAKLTHQNTTTIRIALAVGYTLFIELGAALMLYFSLAHFQIQIKEKASGPQINPTGSTTVGHTTRADPGTGTGRAEPQGLLVRPTPVTTPRDRPGNTKPPIPRIRSLPRKS